MRLYPTAEGSTFISGYHIKIFRPECNPTFQSVHCKGPEDCPGLSDPYKTKLQKYLEQFCLEP